MSSLSLMSLPYADTALDPVITAHTLSFHHGKHHKAYVDNGNNLIKDTELAGRSMPDIIRAVHGDAAKVGIYNNVAQVYNHDFYWKSMRPGGGGAPTGRIGERIAAAFGSYDEFRKAFHTGGMTQFGSGWVWLVSDAAGALKVVKTGNADTPLTAGLTPLLTCDVWEHAYYLDWQNRRADYLNAWLDKLVNWEFAEQNLG